MFDFLFQLIKRKESSTVSKITAAASEYRTLSLDSMSKVFSSDMSIKQITVCKDTIDTYNLFLKFIIDYLKYDKQLAIIHFKNEEKTIYLRDFFIDRNNNYLEPISAMVTFRMLAAELLDLYQEKENILDPIFIIQSNLRLTRGVISNLISVLQNLKSL